MVSQTVTLTSATAAIRALARAGRVDDILTVAGDWAAKLSGAPRAWVVAQPGIVAAPIARAHGVIICTLAPEGLVMLDLERVEPEQATAEIDAALTQLAEVSGLAFESARLRQQVEAVTTSREALLSGIAHDLRNPLNAFSMASSLLREHLVKKEGDPVVGVALLTRMKRAAARMLGIVEDLGDAGRLDARQTVFEVRSEHSAQLVRDAVLAAMGDGVEKTVTVTSGGLDEGSHVLADRNRALQLFAKVIAFQAKAAGERGSIRLGVQRSGDVTVFTSRALGFDGVELSAPPDGQAGLAFLLAQGLAVGQQGEITVDPGVGFNVTITLPSAKPDLARTSLEDATAA